MNITKKLCDEISKLDYRDLPRNALSMAKRCITDFIGVTLAGSCEPISRPILGYLRAVGGHEESTILGLKLKSSCPNAALANGTLGHVLDFDDFVDYGPILHPTGTVLPAIFALAEKQGSNGKEILTAFTLGVETELRISRAVMPHHYEIGWHPTGTIGTLGAAVAAARLLGLQGHEIAQALGIAGSAASGLLENVGTFTKSLHAGRAGMNGVFAALLSQKGLTAAEDILGGKYGFCRVMRPDTNPDVIVEGFGERWDVIDHGVVIRPYPCCGDLIAVLEPLIQVLKQYDITAEEIRSVEVRMTKEMKDTLRFPSPKTVLEAKNSAEYCISLALLERNISIKHFHGSTFLRNKHVREQMRKISTTLNAETERDGYLTEMVPETEITLRNGERVVAKLASKSRRKGDIGNPLSDQELLRKYIDCASLALHETNVRESFALLTQLEDLDDLQRLMLTLS